MSTEYLKLDKQTAKKLYPSSPSFFQETLKATFGENTFFEKITDCVKTFEDACEVLGINPEDVLRRSHSEFLDAHIKSINAYCKLTVIALALNEGWTPDWSNTNQYKYVAWFKHKSGFGLSYGDYDYWLTHTYVGSRLCFKSAELAEYAGKQFEDIYRDYLTL